MENIFNKISFNKIFFRGKSFSQEFVNDGVKKLCEFMGDTDGDNSPFVYLYALNHIKTLLAYFAIIESGKVAVLVDPGIKTFELEDMKQIAPPGVSILINNDTLEFDNEAEVVFHHSEIRDIEEEDLRDVCTMIFTAAEEGYGKFAMLTKENLYANAMAGKESDDVNEQNIFFGLLPIHHLFGLQTGVLTPGFSGASICISEISSYLSLQNYCRVIYDYQVTNIYSVPLVYYLLAKDPMVKKAMEHSPRVCSGGYKLPDSIGDLFLSKTNIELVEGYGITEASPVCTWHKLGSQIKRGSVGQAYPGCEISIVDQNHDTVTAGEIGEVRVQGKNVFKGYYKDKKATDKVLVNRSLYTGDHGKLDEDGFLYLSGAKKHMFNVVGRNVYPAEVERYIGKNENVVTCNLFSENSSRLGELIRSKIKLKNNSPESQKKFIMWCRENISSFKVPKTFEFI